MFLQWKHPLKALFTSPVKTNWSTNVHGINKGKKFITSLTCKIVAIYIYLIFKKENFALQFLFPLCYVNIVPPLMTIPLQNNILWKVTHDTVHAKNPQFFGANKMWMKTC